MKQFPLLPYRTRVSFLLLWVIGMCSMFLDAGAIREPGEEADENNKQPTPILQLPRPQEAALAECDDYFITSDGSPIVRLYDARSKIFLDEEDFAAGTLERAAFSTNGHYLALHYHHGGGAGAAIHVFSTSAGQLVSEREIWPSVDVGNGIEALGSFARDTQFVRELR